MPDANVRRARGSVGWFHSTATRTDPPDRRGDGRGLRYWEVPSNTVVACRRSNVDAADGQNVVGSD